MEAFAAANLEIGKLGDIKKGLILRTYTKVQENGSGSLGKCHAMYGVMRKRSQVLLHQSEGKYTRRDIRNW